MEQSTSQQRKILVIDDDKTVQHLLERILSRHGYTVAVASGADEGLQLLTTLKPDLVLLDILMPGMDGWNTCQRIQELTETPVIMLSALSKDEDIIRGLDAGAVDYVAKPFNQKILLARIRAGLRQAVTLSTKDPTLHYGDNYLAVDLSSGTVNVKNQPVRLTATEYNLLAYLLQNAGKPCSIQEILTTVWGWEYQDNLDYIYSCINQLRMKLEPDYGRPRYILTEPGVGYRFMKQAA